MEQFIFHIESALIDVEPGSLAADTEFKGLPSWDSLAVLTVTDTIDMEYGVVLRKSDFENAATFADLFACVKGKQA